MVVDWVMKRTVEHAGTGIRWKKTTTLEDLDFADDLALRSSQVHSHTSRQRLTA